MSRSKQAGFQAAPLLAAVFAAAGLLVVVLVFWPEDPAPGIALRSSRQCLECHADVASEWEQSQHAKAFTNPEVRKLSLDFQNEECLACHTPRAVLAFAPGERVLARQADRGMGVDCLACHQIPGADGVATGNPSPNGNAPCRPQHEPRLRSVDYCGSCHNQHGTVDQWEASPPHLKGSGCLDCHMPEVWREGGRRGHDHSSLGGHDRSVLEQAVTFEAGWEDESAKKAFVRIRNVGAAHNFPTDERSRAADIQLRRQNAAGEWSEWEHVWRMRDPYRDEVDLTNTQLPSGAEWLKAFDFLDNQQGLEFRLLYRTNPYMPDDEALELYRASVGS